MSKLDIAQEIKKCETPYDDVSHSKRRINLSILLDSTIIAP